MTRHIELDRRFRDLSKSEIERAELDDPDTLAWFSDGNLGKYEGWPELLQQPRLLLLAEAGSGKTAEMREQAKRLFVQGKFGLFLDLASLAHRSPTELMSAAEEERFSAWKSDSSSTAWFFLDAVDELKLTQGKLETALTSFAKAVGSNLNRAHIVVSCRPTDWRVSIDLATMEERLPYQQATVPSVSTPTQAFLAALGNRRDKTKERESGPIKPEGIRVVSLLPLGSRQIELLARELRVSDPSRFIAEIDRQHAWWLARRPLDLSELVATWNDLKSLGTRAQQHESNVTAKLKDGPGRPDRGVLSEAKARLGAEQVALALALTRKLTISAPELAADVVRAGDALDLAEILQDWSEDERQSLLRRALFDPATYGRVRFHNRSVQEYLAARRLVSLKSKGMPTKSLLRLLFAERYDVLTVIPSRKPIAAWLSLWNDDVRRELLIREPETLLALGDPESLSLETRAALLRAFAHIYGQGDGRGINIPIDEVRRLAHPRLGKVVRELWGDGTANEDVRELLLELIWKGAIEDCADIAERAAYNRNYPSSDRTTAINALVACKSFLAARKVVESMLSDVGSWPSKVIHDTASDLFPEVMSPNDLRALIETTPEPQRAVGGFEWALRTIVGRLDVCSNVAIELRDQLAEVVWDGRNPNLEWHHISSRFGHVTPALAILCERLLSAKRGVVNADQIRACIIAVRFSEQTISRGEFVETLRTHFKENESLRAAAFWAELAIMDELCSHKGLWDRMYHVLHGTLLVNVTEADRPWLEVALVDGSASERREVALELLLRLWHQRGRRKKEAKTLLLSLKDDGALYEFALRQTGPLVVDPAIVRFEQSSKRRNRDHDSREKKRLEGWTKWRDKLLAKPSTAFSKRNVRWTVHNLFVWLSGRPLDRRHYNVWDQVALTEAFGSEIAASAAKAFQTIWRAERPTIWSQLDAKARNSTPYVWMYGLCGIASESASPDWARKLSVEEARTAIIYATVEINGFPNWLCDLAKTHPSQIDQVLGSELAVELSLGADFQYLSTLQAVAYSDVEVQRLLVPRLLSCLESWPRQFANEEAGKNLSSHLKTVLRILTNTVDAAQRETVLRLSHDHFLSDVAGPLGQIWLNELFRSDITLGFQALEAGTAEIPNELQEEWALRCLAELFGDRRNPLGLVGQPNSRAFALAGLVRFAYIHIKGPDQYHEGVYTSDVRDQAQTARSFLLSSLLDTPGPEAYRAVLDLADDPLFVQLADRLRYLARDRVARDAEPDEYRATDLVILNSRLEAPPSSRDSLFDVMSDRLGDLSHELEHDDFSDRRTLSTIREEAEMQRTLAARLRNISNGAYVVIREDEVADQKKTDIRLLSVLGNQKAVIEVKIADKRWSMAQLRKALVSQLVGQYLRHETCKAGCLLLTNNGSRTVWRRTDNGRQLDFAGLITVLSNDAKALERQQSFGIKLVVWGLDLTSPRSRRAHSTQPKSGRVKARIGKGVKTRPARRSH